MAAAAGAGSSSCELGESSGSAARATSPAPAELSDCPDACPPRPALLRILQARLHADQELAGVRRALPPLALPMPPAPELRDSHRPEAVMLSAGGGMGVRAAATVALPAAPPEPAVSAANVGRAAAAASAASGTEVVALTLVPSQAAAAPSPVHGAANAALTAAAAAPAAAAFAAPAPVASASCSSTSLSSPSSDGKSDFITHLLTRFPFNAMATTSSQEGPLRGWLHRLPPAHLLMVAFHFGVWGDYTLQERKDQRGRGVKTDTRAYLVRRDTISKNHGLRPCAFVPGELHKELRRRDVHFSELGKKVVQSDMDKHISQAMRQIVGLYLCPSTLLSGFHVLLKDAKTSSSNAVAYLQQQIPPLASEEGYRWSLLHLLKQWASMKGGAAAAVDVAHLCEQLRLDGVHVPASPPAVASAFFLELLWCNMLVEYVELFHLEAFLMHSFSIPMEQLPHHRARMAEASELITAQVAQSASMHHVAPAATAAVTAIQLRPAAMSTTQQPAFAASSADLSSMQSHAALPPEWPTPPPALLPEQASTQSPWSSSMPLQSDLLPPFSQAHPLYLGLDGAPSESVDMHPHGTHASISAAAASMNPLQSPGPHGSMSGDFSSYMHDTTRPATPTEEDDTYGAAAGAMYDLPSSPAPFLPPPFHADQL